MSGWIAGWPEAQTAEKPGHRCPAPRPTSVCWRSIRKIRIRCMPVVRVGSLRFALRNDVMMGVRLAAVPAGKQPDQADDCRLKAGRFGCDWKAPEEPGAPTLSATLRRTAAPPSCR